MTSSWWAFTIGMLVGGALGLGIAGWEVGRAVYRGELIVADLDEGERDG